MLRKFRERINNMSDKKFNTILVIVVVCLAVAVAYDLRSKLINGLVTSRVELVTSVYRISNQCIFDYFADYITEDGYIVSLDPPPDDCEATHLTDVVRMMHGYETEQELEVMAEDLYNTVVELNANATFMKSCKLINIETGEVIEDMTEELRNTEMMEFLNSPKFNV